MQSRIRVVVTPEDIERAKRNDSYVCVVAQAVARTVKDAGRIEVDTQTVRFTRAGERFVYMTPYAVQGYIIAFDAGEPIEPFSFQLRDPRRSRSRRRTAVGKSLAKVATAAIRRTKRAKPDASAEDLRAAAKAAYTDARTVLGDGKATEGGPRRAGPPRVFKRKSRSYGQRLLRINRAEVTAP